MQKPTPQPTQAHSRSDAEWDRAMFKSTIEAGQHALRVAMAINGGAAVAILAFVGNMMTKSPQIDLKHFPTAMLLFVAGVLTAAIATAGTYVSQRCYQHKRENFGNISNGIVMGLVLSSYLLFALGAWMAFVSFKR